MKYNELISIIISSLSLLLSVIVTIHNFSLNKENKKLKFYNSLIGKNVENFIKKLTQEIDNFIINDFEINNKYSTQKIKKLIFDLKKNMMIEKYINEDDFNLLKKYLIDIDETVIILKDKCKSKDTQYMKEKICYLQYIVKKLFVFIKKKYF